MYRFFPDDGTRALIELRFGHIISFFFFNDTATTEIYTLSLHDALPILLTLFPPTRAEAEGPSSEWNPQIPPIRTDRKSTRLNSSHDQISYAVFCLKKKKNRDEALDGVLWARHVDSKPRV